MIDVATPPLMISARICGWSSPPRPWTRHPVTAGARGAWLAYFSAGDYWIVRLRPSQTMRISTARRLGAKRP